MAANTTGVHNVSDGDTWNVRQALTVGPQVRSNRTNMGSSGMNNDRARGSHNNSVGKSFGAGKSNWNNIWGDSNLGNGFGDGMYHLEGNFEFERGSKIFC